VRSPGCSFHLAGSSQAVVRPVSRATLRGMLRIVVGPSVHWVLSFGPDGLVVYAEERP
jgi:hypothetical protein